MTHADYDSSIISTSLLERIADGDEAAFSTLYHFYLPRLDPVRWRCIESGLDPVEVLQLTFIKIWLNRDRLGEIEHLDAWIIKIAYREYLMAVRGKLTYEEKIRQYGQAIGLGSAPLTPYQHANYNDLMHCVQAVISQLSPQRKRIYELSRVKGLKIIEIAKTLGISSNTVKSVLQTVLKQVREKLAEGGYRIPTILFFLQILFFQ